MKMEQTTHKLQTYFMNQKQVIKIFNYIEKCKKKKKNSQPNTCFNLSHPFTEAIKRQKLENNFKSRVFEILYRKYKEYRALMFALLHNV